MRRIGDRAMTSSERQKRFLAKLKATAAANARATAVRAPKLPPLAGGEMISVESLRLHPRQSGRWLYDQMGRKALWTLMQQISWVLGRHSGRGGK